MQMVMTLDDVSQGGFSAEASEEVAVGSVMRFRFSAADGAWATVLTAQAMHSRQAGAVPGGRGFTVGFKFLNAESPRVAANIDALIARATAVNTVC